MKHLNHLLLIAAAIAGLASCKKEDDAVASPGNPAPGAAEMQLVASGTVDGYTVEIYGKGTNLYTGYNTVYARLKNAAGSYLGDAGLTWEPVMTMTMGGMEHTHGCPWSAPVAVAGNASLYEEYMVFIMASSSMGHWDLKVNFTIGGTTHELHLPLPVLDSESEFHKVYTSSMGSDGTTYFLAMLEPAAPMTGVNDMVVGLFRRESDSAFPVVDGYTIRVDPRMPGMGNHGAPGNEDLVQGTDGFYHGKAGFSMTGYWKVNLMVENSAGQVLCGNAVTTEVAESSVSFKVNF